MTHLWSAKSLFSYPPNCFIIIKFCIWCLITMMGIVNHRLADCGVNILLLCVARNWVKNVKRNKKLFPPSFRWTMVIPVGKVAWKITGRWSFRV